ncbi:MAG: hypothetical protein IPM37_10260 [Hahellaceae bacterium]|nr:hypothetical protein [Hahellaceae bacterium]
MIDCPRCHHPLTLPRWTSLVACSACGSPLRISRPTPAGPSPWEGAGYLVLIAAATALGKHVSVNPVYVLLPILALYATFQRRKESKAASPMVTCISESERAFAKQDQWVFLTLVCLALLGIALLVSVGLPGRM